MKKKAIGLVFLAALMQVAAVIASVAEEQTEHPLIRPFPKSVLDERTSFQQSFNAYDFRVGTPRSYESHNIEGEYRRLRYILYQEDGTPNREVSRPEYFGNFKAAALERGGMVKYEDQHYGLVFTIPRADGGLIWCHVQATPAAGRHDFHIIDAKPLKTSLVFNSAEMMTALDAEGKVTLYGILFDFDKATLQPASNSQLQEVMNLLFENPALSLEIQGHTDSDGSEAYNLELSRLRAESVLRYLVLFGIDPSRVQARGYGETMPVAPNDTEENKAKNRRVELVRMIR